MKKQKNDILPASPEELRMIAKLTDNPVFDRLDTGDLEIVESDDWSKVPKIEESARRSIIH